MGDGLCRALEGMLEKGWRERRTGLDLVRSPRLGSRIARALEDNDCPDIARGFAAVGASLPSKPAGKPETMPELPRIGVPESVVCARKKEERLSSERFFASAGDFLGP